MAANRAIPDRHALRVAKKPQGLRWTNRLERRKLFCGMYRLEAIYTLNIEWWIM